MSSRVRIETLVVRVPHELGARARALGPLIAGQLAVADWGTGCRVGSVRVGGVRVESGWSNASIAGAVARAAAARVVSGAGGEKE